MAHDAILISIHTGVQRFKITLIQWDSTKSRDLIKIEPFSRRLLCEVEKESKRAWKKQLNLWQNKKIISENCRHDAVKNQLPCCCLFPARSHGDASYTIYWHLATSYFVPLSSLESPTCLISEKVQASSGRPHVDLLNTRRCVETSLITPNVKLSQTPTGQEHLRHLWPSQRSLRYYSCFTWDERGSAGSARELAELKE